MHENACQFLFRRWLTTAMNKLNVFFNVLILLLLAVDYDISPLPMKKFPNLKALAKVWVFKLENLTSKNIS